MASTLNTENQRHSAADAAMGFYYQSLYALRSILNTPHDNATVCVERLDDVEVISNGQTLAMQLKHSLRDKPPPVSLSSLALWKTLKAWIDVLPKVEISDTRFQLVSVAPLGRNDVLSALLDDSADRTDLNEALVTEARRVVDEHEHGKTKGKKPFPHADRVGCCIAFLTLDESQRSLFLSRITAVPGVSDITEITRDISNSLSNFPPERREAIGKRLIEWWDVQIIYSLCGKRERFVSKLEVQQEVSSLAGEIQRDELVADYAASYPPQGYVPNSMIARQIRLVGGSSIEIEAAEREEWRARSQRHKWLTERIDMAARIERYDAHLHEAWCLQHGVMSEDCASADETIKRSSGLTVFRWSFNLAHTQVDAFARNWSASYYVRGSYQVMATQLNVGWHPEFRTLLSGATA